MPSATVLKPVTLPCLPYRVFAPQDHDGFTALHLAAKFGHPDAVALLLRAATESAAAAAPAAAEAAEELAAMAAAAAARAAAEAEAAAAAAAAAEAEADGAEGAAATPPRPAAPPPPSAEALAALFPVAEAPSLYKIKTRSEGQTALQLAALHGRAEAVGALLAGAGQLKGLTVTDKKGRTAEQLARRRGHTVSRTMHPHCCCRAHQAPGHRCKAMQLLQPAFRNTHVPAAGTPGPPYRFWRQPSRQWPRGSPSTWRQRPQPWPPLTAPPPPRQAPPAPARCCWRPPTACCTARRRSPWRAGRPSRRRRT